MKIQPITYLLESCIDLRDGMGETLTAVHVARAIEHRNIYPVGRRGSKLGRGQHDILRYGETTIGPTVSENSWTHVRTLLGSGMSLSCSVVVQDRNGKVYNIEVREVRDGEVSEQGAIRGTDAAKCLTQGEVARSYHTPCSERGSCVPRD